MPPDPAAENLPFVEQLYGRFLTDEGSVPESWRRYFRSLGERTPVPQPAFAPRSIFASRVRHDGPAPDARFLEEARQDRVAKLVQAYRQRGHLYARLDPLGIARPPRPDFDLGAFGLEPADLDRTFVAGGMRGTLRELIAHLEETYCRTIGVELVQIDDEEQMDWLVDRMEATQNHLPMTPAEQRGILEKLTDAEIFEQFLHTKFVGYKRFSLEGAESFIPMMELLIERSAEHGMEEVVIGMAHRGRLNVLTNVVGMPYREIFAEFADEDPSLYIGRGDVKYHLGYSGDREFAGRQVHLSLSFNPSHLEFVDAVVEGRVRAKQDRRGDRERRRVLPLVVHGDAAIAGQGIVAELFNMSKLAGYDVGGTIHVVINNQIGFTTPPEEARSTRYATDVARMLPIPIFHVNGEDPESVAQVCRLAADYRAKFQQDVVIDLWSYRKYGHNEGDEPSYTQPTVYKVIAEHPTVREQYVRQIVESGAITRDAAEEMAASRKLMLEEQLAEAKKAHARRRPSAMAGLWARYAGGEAQDVPEVPTALPLAKLHELSKKLVTLPPGFHLHPKLVRLMENRAAMGRGEMPLDWGMGEALAYASLVSEGTRVRLTGQDVERGTFSHRHAVLFDHETGAPFVPLAAIGPGPFEVVNSPLSEVSALGYEYGYSLDTPDGLVAWEAQFGDFANAAQVIIDQFIASGEDKWHRLSGLTLFLPHGFEGQGPEHSSARLDRWLSLSAEDNIQVCNVTTPAQIFHLLRRQVLRPYRKPLVLMSPKSLLRLPAAVSPLSELAEGSFQKVIDDNTLGAEARAGVTRVILCAGKIFYELAEERKARKRQDLAIVRVEQLYPTPVSDIERVVAGYPSLREVVWVQEEPRNYGAWLHMWTELTAAGLRAPLASVTRPRSASPATGSGSSHKLEQRRVLEAAFAPIGQPA